MLFFGEHQDQLCPEHRDLWLLPRQLLAPAELQHGGEHEHTTVIAILLLWWPHSGCTADWGSSRGKQPGPTLTTDVEANQGASDCALRQSSCSWGAKANMCKSICSTTGVVRPVHHTSQSGAGGVGCQDKAQSTAVDVQECRHGHWRWGENVPRRTRRHAHCGGGLSDLS